MLLIYKGKREVEFCPKREDFLGITPGFGHGDHGPLEAAWASENW
jgi:hypothetical protein